MSPTEVGLMRKGSSNSFSSKQRGSEHISPILGTEDVRPRVWHGRPCGGVTLKNLQHLHQAS